MLFLGSELVFTKVNGPWVMSLPGRAAHIKNMNPLPTQLQRIHALALSSLFFLLSLADAKIDFYQCVCGYVCVVNEMSFYTERGWLRVFSVCCISLCANRIQTITSLTPFFSPSFFVSLQNKSTYTITELPYHTNHIQLSVYFVFGLYFWISIYTTVFFFSVL